MNIIAGWMIPEMNCARKLASYSSRFIPSNTRSARRCLPNTFTMLWPVKTSSM
jgi:hypothetical protein